MNPFFFMRHIRILPITIASLCLLLTAKVYDIYESGNAFSQAFLGREAYAQEEQIANNPQPVEVEETQLAAIDNDTDDTLLAPAAAKPTSNPKEFSDIELDILQSLSERREELDTLEKEIRMKGNVLDATELRLDQKIEQIKALEKTMTELLKEYDEEEDAKIRSLVKIYENMKPKEAALIFNELEMPILLLVVDRMAERRAAPILAKMLPLKAKQLTVELAEQRKVRTKKKAMMGVPAR